MAITVEDLTGDQRNALEQVKRLLTLSTEVPETLVICGPAGTGKTTLLKIITEVIGKSLIVAPTGKAALRVREATGCDASTIHRLLFKAVQDSQTGDMVYTLRDPNEVAESPSGVLIADEASMINEELYDSIYVMAHAKRWHLVFLGDNAQLPPVTTNGRPFNILDQKLFKSTLRSDLTQIVRQVAGDPLIQTLTYLRENKLPEAMKRLEGIPQHKLVSEAVGVVQRGGALICHTNALRHILNRAIRAELGYSDKVQNGEPLMVLKNMYSDAIDLFNGEVVAFNRWHTEPKGPYAVENRYVVPPAVQRVYFGRGLVQAGRDELRAVMCMEEIFGQLEKDITAGALAARAKQEWGRKDPVLSVSFAYAITCHKAQGGEFPEVLVVPDKVQMHTPEGRKWWYTSCSRSKTKVRICFYDGTKPLENRV